MTTRENARWRPVAVASDIPKGVVVPATLPTGPIAVWRSATGILRANGDRCPHRGMRLSHGFVRGETLNCIYHGWRYGPDGSCEHIPAHPGVAPPKSINCGPLALRETSGVVWVSTSEPDVDPEMPLGFEALRSLQFAVSADALRQYGTSHSAFSVTFSDGGLHCLVNDISPTSCLVIVLVPTNADPAERLDLSDRIEGVRRSVEADFASEAVA